MIRLEILGKPRSAKNSKQIGFFKDARSKTGWRYTLVDSSATKRWRKLAVPQLELAWRGSKPIEDTGLACIVTSYCGGGIEPDADNLLGGPFDALQVAKVIDNDRQFDTAISIRKRDTSNPRTEILICENDELEISIRSPALLEQYRAMLLEAIDASGSSPRDVCPCLPECWYCRARAMVGVEK